MATYINTKQLVNNTSKNSPYFDQELTDEKTMLSYTIKKLIDGVASLVDGKSRGLCLAQLCAKYRPVHAA